MHRLRTLWRSYPPQFWLMFAGMVLSTIGSSMIWPFLTIYVRKRLGISLTAAASLWSINAALGLIASIGSGLIVDRLGRKWVMVISLIGNGACYFTLGSASSFPAFAVVMGLMGTFNPLYRVGSDAMMADLIEPERRADAYSLLRMSNNLGIALGPTIGGFMAVSSYNLAFLFAAIGLCGYGLLVAFFAKETMPDGLKQQSVVALLKGYGHILRDRRFAIFLIAFTAVSIATMNVWVLMGTYAYDHFQVSENLYGFIPTTNAILCVTLQYAVTQWTKRRRTMPMLALGAGLYAIAAGSVALARSFWGFWVSMVIMTFGELVLVPTATTHVANSAPQDARGRYVGLYGLTHTAASMVGPVYGGALGDRFGPAATWYGSALAGAISTVIYLFLSARKAPVPEERRAPA